MGKQINYYVGYSDFLHIAQQAVDCGCEILKKENGKIIRSADIDIVTPDINRYYFYLSQAGDLTINKRNGEEYIGGYSSSGNVVIEASFSIINHAEKKISRGRLFSITGFNDDQGNWIDRPECVKKVYEKLVRAIKKTAPYTEIVDVIITSFTECNEPKEWKHTEYISTELLKLKVEFGYKISL